MSGTRSITTCNIPEYQADQRKGAGHRKRLRERFQQSGLAGFHDYEIVELLLTLNTPRKDCKEMAKAAIKEFKTLQGVLGASSEDLQRIDGIGPTNSFGIKLFQALEERLAEEQIPDKLELKSTHAIASYLQKTIGQKKKEHFLVLYLDSQGHLVDRRVVSIGTLTSALVHPREVFEPAVAFRAASIIVGHNHPSGSVEPSAEDRAITKQLAETGRVLDIVLRDHVIVSSTEYFSFQQQLLL